MKWNKYDTVMEMWSTLNGGLCWNISTQRGQNLMWWLHIFIMRSPQPSISKRTRERLQLEKGSPVLLRWPGPVWWERDWSQLHRPCRLQSERDKKKKQVHHEKLISIYNVYAITVFWRPLTKGRDTPLCLCYTQRRTWSRQSLGTTDWLE